MTSPVREFLGRQNLQVHAASCLVGHRGCMLDWIMVRLRLALPVPRFNAAPWL